MTKMICHIVAKGQVPSTHDKDRAAALTGGGTAEHRVFEVTDLAMCSRSISADLIVSHLAVSWRKFPFLVALRAMNPDQQIVHMPPNREKTSSISLHNCAMSLFDDVYEDAA